MSCRIVVDKTFVPRPRQTQIDAGGFQALNSLTMRTQCNGQDLGLDTFFYEYYQPDGQPAQLFLRELSGSFPFTFSLSAIFWQRNIGWMLIRSAGAPGEVVRVDFQQPGQPPRPPSYNFEFTPNPMIEGRTTSVRIKGENIPDDHPQVYLAPIYSSPGSTANNDDINGLINTASSPFNIYNEAFFNITPSADDRTEGTESVVMGLYNTRNQLLASASVAIQDVPPPEPAKPSYQIIVDQNQISVNEDFMVRIATQNRPIGGEMYYEIRPSGDEASNLQLGDIDKPINSFVSFRTQAPGANFTFQIRALDHRNYVDKSFQIRVYDGNGVPGSLVLISDILTIQAEQPPSCGPYEDQEVVGSITGGTVWGSNPYTDDSDFNVAAVHAGLIQPGQLATIRKNSSGYQQNFTGSVRNGISAKNWTTGWCGVSINLINLITFNLSGPDQTEEGGSPVVLFLATTGIEDNTLIEYSIAGISDLDIDIPLTGTLEIQNGMAMIQFSAIADGLADGNETMRFFVSYRGQQQARKDILILDAQTFELSAPTVVNEGDIFVIRLDTGSVPNGTAVPFTITGVTGTDIRWRNPGNGFAFASTGSFVVNSDSAEIEVMVIADNLTEGPESFTLSLNNGKDSVTIEINDTSLDPTYTLTAPASADEGTSFVVRLDTTGLTDGTAVPFTITGVTPGSDITWRKNGTLDFPSSGATGNFEVSSDFAEIEVIVREDVLTEGPETFTLTLSGRTESVDVLINDTSLDPTYTLTAPASANEGTSFVVRLDTQRVPDGSEIPFTITGVTPGSDITWRKNGTGDFPSSGATGNFEVSSDFAEIEVLVLADILTEGPETFTLTLTGRTESVDVLINDTSLDPTYELTGPATAKEGQEIIIQLNTTEISDGTLVPFVLTGLSLGEVQWRATPGTGSYQSSLSGNFTVNGNTSQIELLLIVDQENDDSETLTIAVNNGGSTHSVSITDTTPILSASPSASVAEGETLTVILTNIDLPNGTLVPYVISGVSSSDLVGNPPLMGNFDVQNNQSMVSFDIALDFITGETETFVLSLVDYPMISVSVPITDNSPTFMLTGDPLTQVNEGNSWTVTLTTTRLMDGTEIPYTLSGIDTTDVGVPLTGNFTIIDNSAQVVIPILVDTESSEVDTLTLSLDNGQASVDITVLDEPGYQLLSSYGPTETQAYPGQIFEIRLITERLELGTLVPFTITGLGIDEVEETLEPTTQEGGNIVYQPGMISGSFVVQNFLGVAQGDQFRLYLNPDLAVMGSLTFTVSLDNGADDLTLEILEGTGSSLFNAALLFNPSSIIADIDPGYQFSYDPATYNGVVKNTAPGGNGGSMSRWDLVSGDTDQVADSHEPEFRGSVGVLDPNTYLEFTDGADGKYLQQQVISPPPGGYFQPWGVFAVGILEMAWHLPVTPASGVNSVYLIHLGRHNSPDALPSYIRYEYTNHELTFVMAGVIDTIAMPVAAIGKPWMMSVRAGLGTVQVWINGIQQEFRNSGLTMFTGYTSISFQGGHFAVIGGGSTNRTSTDGFSNNGFSASGGAKSGEKFFFVRYWSTDLGSWDDESAENNFLYSAARIGAQGFSSFSPGEQYTLSYTGVPQEGNTIVVKLETSGVNDGTLIPYTITGISASDISTGSLTGNFVVSALSPNYGTATLSLGLVADQTTEGDETFTLALDNGQDDLTITIQDTSQDPPIVPPSSTLAQENQIVGWWDPSDSVSNAVSGELDNIVNPGFGNSEKWFYDNLTLSGAVGQADENTYLSGSDSMLLGTVAENLALISNRWKAFEIGTYLDSSVGFIDIYNSDRGSSYKGQMSFFGSSNVLRVQVFRNDGVALTRDVIVAPEFLNTPLHIAMTHISGQGILLLNGQRQTFTSGDNFIPMPEGTSSSTYYGLGFHNMEFAGQNRFYFLRTYSVNTNVTEAELINNLGYSLGRLGFI